MTERMSSEEYRKQMSGGLYTGKSGDKPKVITPSEKNIQKSIEGYLSTFGRKVYVDRLNSGSVQVVKEYKDKKGRWVQNKNWIRLCKPGTPDLYFICIGFANYVECKTLTGKYRATQIERQQDLRDAGATVFNPKSLEEFIDQFHNAYPQFPKPKFEFRQEDPNA